MLLPDFAWARGGGGGHGGRGGGPSHSSGHSSHSSHSYSSGRSYPHVRRYYSSHKRVKRFRFFGAYYSDYEPLYYGYYTDAGDYIALDSPQYGAVEPRKSRLIIKVPSKDAEVEVNGKELTKKTETHTYRARVRLGRTRTFRVTARWEDEDGNRVKLTKKVRLRAGQRKVVRFEEPTP
jgi:uncharacterized protein (TIGR03000 family)